MQAAVPSGGPSPKPSNSPSSAQPLKSGSDSIQNTGALSPSQSKGKKRERGDQGTDPSKRERSTKSEDGDHATSRFGTMLKTDVAKITGKGGLLTTDEVERLVYLMQLDRTERRLDLAGRVLIADAIAATDRSDCLSKFVQLKGVPVLDDWLQEVHKGKVGDGSPKGSDKAVEELVLALLRALDKLPVNLNALKTCNIGKSVNNLRGHKNLEIQKKARSLVDTWKRRVDLEIKTNDARSAGSNQQDSWPGKSSFSEVTQTANRRAVSTEMTTKSSVTQPSASRVLPDKDAHANAIVKSTPVLFRSLKSPNSMSTSVSAGLKDTVLKAAASSVISELPQTIAKDERSSSSSQSQNNSQSCSSDHAKTMGSSWKEDARSSTAGSINGNKSSRGSSRHRRLSSAFPETSISRVQKESNSGKSSARSRAVTLDTVSKGELNCEKALDSPGQEHGNDHKFIVRLPNPGRSPVQSGSGGLFEDPSAVGSGVSSPATTVKLADNDCNIEARTEACRSHALKDANTESWQSNDVKEAGSNIGDRSPTVILDEEHRCADETEKAIDISRVACSSSGNEKGLFNAEPKTVNPFSSMDAFIESCTNTSKTTASLPSGDDTGMNLFANVAAGEMCTESPGRAPAAHPCAVNDGSNARLPCDDGKALTFVKSDENIDADSEKHEGHVGSDVIRDEVQDVVTDYSGDNRSITLKQENSLNGKGNDQHSEDANSLLNSEGKLEEGANKCLSVCTPSNTKEFGTDETVQQQDKRKTGEQVIDSLMDCKPKVEGTSIDDNKSIGSSHEKHSEANRCNSDVIHNSSFDESHNDCTPSGRKSEKFVVEDYSLPLVDTSMQSGITSNKQQPTDVVQNHTENTDMKVSGNRASTEAEKSGSSDSKARDTDSLQVGQLVLGDIGRREPSTVSSLSVNEHADSMLASPATITTGVKMALEIKEALDRHPAGAANLEGSPIPPSQETDIRKEPTACKLSVADADGDRVAPSAKSSSNIVASEPEFVAKHDFDLNEDIPGDDGNRSDPTTSTTLLCSSSLFRPYVQSFTPSPIVNGSSARITVAAPAKGPFVPPENLLKGKAEPGWKGSAATSAFRRAEPRKVLEMPLAVDVPSSGTSSDKQNKLPLDIDLNVVDDRNLEDTAFQCSAQTMDSASGFVINSDASLQSAGRLNLDLNRDDEGAENGHLSASTSRRFDVPLLPVRVAPDRFPAGEANMLRDFDLNNGPGIDDVGAESLARSPHAKSNTSVPFLHSVSGLRMSNAELGSVSSWFPPGNTYPVVSLPSFQPYPIVAAPGAQRVLGPVSGGSTFSGDIYRGPVLSSSPAMAFSTATSFPYAGYPFGPSFPVASTSFSGVSTPYIDSSLGGGLSFPAISSQLVGQAGAVPSHYPRPYMLGLQEGSSNSGSESSRKWSRHGLDLNAGPVNADMEVKDDRLGAASRQFSVTNSQSVVEEQARMYQVAGSALKRKEPEGGLDGQIYAYKQHSWQ